MTDLRIAVDSSHLTLGLNEPWARNPLRKWPKYDPCFCGSGAKATFCCLPRQPHYIDRKDAVTLFEAMELGQVGRDAIIREYQRHADELMLLKVKEQNDKPKPVQGE